MGLLQTLHQATVHGYITHAEASKIQAAAMADHTALVALGGADAKSVRDVAARLGIVGSKRAKLDRTEPKAPVEEEEEEDPEDGDDDDDDDPDDDDDQTPDSEKEGTPMKTTKTGNRALDAALDFSSMSENIQRDVRWAADAAGLSVNAYLEKLRADAARPGRGADSLIGLPKGRSK